MFETRNLQNPAVLTEVRIGGCFSREAPLLWVGGMWYPSGWLFEREKLNEEKLREALEEA